MDKLPLEQLVHIAECIDLISLRSWLLAAKKYHVALIGEYYAKALRLDREAGFPKNLIRAAILNRVTDSLKALLEGTDPENINKSNIGSENTFLNELWSKVGLGKPTIVRGFEPPPVHTTTLLHVVCQLCDEDIVKMVLERGADPSILDAFGWSPLHVVARSGKTAIIRVLLDAGVNVDLPVGGWVPARVTTENSETTALQQAVAGGHLDALELLLEAGANPNAPYKYFRADALALAGGKGNVDVIRRLLSIGCYDKGSITKALTYAAKSTSPLSVQALIDAGGELHEAAASAISNDRPDNLRLLIDAGVDLRKNLRYGSSLLNGVRSVRVTQMILTECPGLAAAARSGMFHGTPLEALYENAEHSAEEDSDEIEEIAMLLIEDGCVIQEPKPINADNDRIYSNRNILEDAAYWGHIRVIRAILERKKSLLNLRHREGYTPLHSAAFSQSKNKVEVFKLLVEQGADIHSNADWGHTLLVSLYTYHHTVAENAVITQYLIDRGIDINGEPGRDPPLVHALSREHDPSAVILMKAGVDIQSPIILQRAVQHGCVESMEYLIQAKNIEQLPASTNSSNESLLHLVVREGLVKNKDIRGYAKMLASLLLGRPELSVEEAAGEEASALEPVAYTGHMEVVRRICSRGLVDVGTRQQNQSVPFDILMQIKRDEVSEFLEEADRKWPRPPNQFDRFLAAMRSRNAQP
ncbi:ankyrin repeat-containing domain protein [Xylogone sp. PMI_703]|nr:ankyrin repeat-containing domain protein [Xylogone sp. PMI_703]